MFLTSLLIAFHIVLFVVIYGMLNADFIAENPKEWFYDIKFRRKHVGMVCLSATMTTMLSIPGLALVLFMTGFAASGISFSMPKEEIL